MPSARHIPLLLVAAPLICCLPCEHTWLCVLVATTAALAGYVVAAIIGELQALGSVRGDCE